MPEWLSWNVIGGAAFVVAGLLVLAWGKLPSLPKLGGSSDAPNYRRGLDGLEVLVDELRKAGEPEAELVAWKQEAVLALLKGQK